jgi:dTDP-4-amino-4,6-dideoxygalactose transaminase
VPPEPPERRHAYHQYTVQTRDRDALVAHLDEFGIDTSVYYPTPIHEQPAYDDWNPAVPVAERAAETVLSIPVHPQLSPADIERVTDAIENFNA